MTYKKPTGLWVAHYPAMYDDPRTQAAAEYLVQHRVPQYVAVLVVVTAWLRLHGHALSEGDDGLTGHLSDRRLAELAWPESADAPRNLGRREKLGGVLRAALHQVPHGLDEGLMGCSCSAECAQRRPLPGRTVLSTCASHEGLTGWEELHGKILGDRRRVRAKRQAAAAKRAGEHAPVVDVSHDTPAPVVRQPGPRRATVARTPYPTHQDGRESPQPPAGPQAAAGLVGEVMQELTGAPPVPPGAAAASSLPGADRDGELGDLRERAQHLILSAAHNVVGQQRNGRDTTCRPGHYYLLRIGTLDAALQGRLTGELGRDPAPGRLLAAAAPEVYERMVHALTKALPGVRKPEAYVRSSLAKAWMEWLGKYADELAEQRYQRRRGEGAGPPARPRRVTLTSGPGGALS